MIGLHLENIEYLLDTYGWIEYFRGSEKGKIVKNLIDTKFVHTSIISIAELSDKYQRENLINEWEQRYKFILSKSHIQQLTLAIAKNSGFRKWTMRKTFKNFGLADAIILETAEMNNLVVVTGDPHFRDLENIIFLE